MRAVGSMKTVGASSNVTPCLARLATAFAGSHSNTTPSYVSARRVPRRRFSLASGGLTTRVVAQHAAPRLDFAGEPPDTTTVFRTEAMRAVVGIASAAAIAALSIEPSEHVHAAATDGRGHAVVHRHVAPSWPGSSSSVGQGDHHHVSAWLNAVFTQVSKHSLNRPATTGAVAQALPGWRFQGHARSADFQPIRGAPRSATIPRAPPSSLPLSL